MRVGNSNLTNDSLSHEEIRMDSYKLLSDCFQIPDRELIDQLNGSDKSQGGLFSEIPDIITETPDVDLLKIDHAKLFLGPYKLLAPPYGSQYLEDVKTIMGNSTMHVSDWYKNEGLVLSIKEVPDHITIEFEFMYFLIFHEVMAIKNNDFNAVSEYLKKQMSFLGTHLGAWISEFCDNVIKNADTDFYRNLAELTKAFVTEDLKTLSERIDMTSGEVNTSSSFIQYPASG
jgi:TorA maturation chaperone TorD